MEFTMQLQVLLKAECSITFGTLVRFLLTVMIEHVYTQLGQLSECGRTFQTGVRLFIGMDACMLFQHRGAGEKFPADRARKRPFTRVDADMSPQVGSLLESLVAGVALIWPFTCVYTKMLTKVTLLPEPHITVSTWEWSLPCMAANVLH